MAHQILQSFGIHAAFSHVGTISMSAHMRCDFGHLYLVDFVVLLADMLEILLPVQRHHGTPILSKYKNLFCHQ